MIPEKNLFGTRTGRLGPQNGVTCDLPTNMPEAYFTAKQDQHNHSGQAHHIFLRFLNLRIFFMKFSLFFYSVVSIEIKTSNKLFIITHKDSFSPLKNEKKS